MNKGFAARLQLVGSYSFLVTLLVIVVFPFYWMTVTSFKGEEQMRSLVSMFWPSPVVTDNYRHLLGKTEFVAWFGNSVFVSVSSTLLIVAGTPSTCGTRSCDTMMLSTPAAIAARNGSR